MTHSECAAIAAYLDASVSAAHVDRDLSDAIEHGWGDHVAVAEGNLEDAASYLEECRLKLPAEFRDYLDEQAQPFMPSFPATPAPMPPGMDVDTWAEMDPAERWEFLYWHHPTLCQDAITTHLCITHPFQATIELANP
jgi:hypothetical protein